MEEQLSEAAMFVLVYSCPSRQRSVFVLSMAMLVFASRIFNIPGITARKNALVGKGLVNMNLSLIWTWTGAKVFFVIICTLIGGPLLRAWCV